MLKTWTFTIRQGNPFCMRIPGNPTLNHHGVFTVQSLLLTDVHATDLATTIGENWGCFVTMSLQEEEEDAKEERAALNRMRAPECPDCLVFASRRHCPVHDCPALLRALGALQDALVNEAGISLDTTLPLSVVGAIDDLKAVVGK